MKKYFFIMLPKPEKMLTYPHRGFWGRFDGRKNHQKGPKIADRYPKVRVSEHYLITVYIYISFFEAFLRYGERCNVYNVH